MIENFKNQEYISSVDMQSKEVMDFLPRMEYIGEDKLSKTQVRKLRVQTAKNFFEQVANTPRWQEKIDELWSYWGDKSIFKLKELAEKEITD